MPIIKTKKTNNFSIIANEIFKNDIISARAKGIYTYLMTLPSDWKIYKNKLLFQVMNISDRRFTPIFLN